jgi:hypothetical protein
MYVALEYVKTQDEKYHRWLRAVDAFCCGNPNYPDYDCNILNSLEAYSIVWKKVR